jgi:hypothetical protein
MVLDIQLREKSLDEFGVGDDETPEAQIPKVKLMTVRSERTRGA